MTNPLDWTALDAVVFDLDGTLYLGEKPLPGSLELLASLPSHLQIRFLSNNTSKTPEQTWEKMIRLGFDLQPDQILSPLNGLVQAIQEQGLTHVWVMANAEVLDWLQQALPQVELRPSRSKTQLVVVAYDDSLTYNDLCEIAWRLQDQRDYWITHPDYVCPHPEGPVPDVGGLVEMMAIGYQRRPQRIFGKPCPEVLAPVLKFCPVQKLLFVGDRLYTDWELAKQVGCHFRLSLNGETTHQDWLQLPEKERPLLF